MNVESVTIVIVVDGRALVIQPTPAQILDIAWQCANDLRERELSGMATFTLRIEGERTAVGGTWIDGRVVVPRIVQP